MVYGRDAPTKLKYEPGTTHNFELENMLKKRDFMLRDVQAHLLKAQNIMKNNVDKHRRDFKLEVGAQVFLKVHPYRQQSVQRCVCHKLVVKWYCPFEVLERVGKVAYRLRLSDDLKIHRVFHVFQLKPV